MRQKFVIRKRPYSWSLNKSIRVLPRNLRFQLLGLRD